jgi:hypothetical protein
MFRDLRKRFLYKTKVVGGAFFQLLLNDRAIHAGAIQANSVEVEKIIGVSEDKLKPKTLEARKFSETFFRFVRGTYVGEGFEFCSDIYISEDFDYPLWMVAVLRRSDRPCFGLIFPAFGGYYLSSAFYIQGYEKIYEYSSPWRHAGFNVLTSPSFTQLGGAQIPLREDGIPEKFFQVAGNFNVSVEHEYVAFYDNKP